MAKKYEQLDFTDDFMFCKILTENPEITRKLASVITGREVVRIESPSKQKPIKLASDGKGVRFDVSFKGDDTIYDIEMQTTRKKNLAKRTRYYQSMIDGEVLSSGDDYTKLPAAYIVFICIDDPFGDGLYTYTFRNQCQENPVRFLNDEVCKIFLNAKGITGQASEDIVQFLQYINTGVISNTLTEEIDDAVDIARLNSNGRREYMTLLERDKEKIEQGRSEEKNKLISNLIESLLEKDPDMSRAIAEKQARELLKI